MPTTTLENAWPTAEKICYDKMVTATAAKDGETAFLGMLPDGAFNSWGFWSGEGRADLTWGQNFNNFVGVGNLLGRYQKRADAQSAAGKITNMLKTTQNVANVGNVQWFRFADGGMPTVVDDLWAVSEAKAILVWRLNITFEMVYHSCDL